MEITLSRLCSIWKSFLQGVEHDILQMSEKFLPNNSRHIIVMQQNIPVCPNCSEYGQLFDTRQSNIVQVCIANSLLLITTAIRVHLLTAMFIASHLCSCTAMIIICLHYASNPCLTFSALFSNIVIN